MKRRDFFRNSLMALGGLAAANAGAETAAATTNPAGKVSCRKLPGGPTVPMLGYGLMRMPKVSAGGSTINREEAARLIETAMKSGVNYFDTAYMYHGGDSEKMVGDVLSKYPRESYYLADKMPLGYLRKAEDLERIFAEQLERTKAGYFDFYLMHNISRHTWGVARKLGVWDYMKKLKAAGKVRHIGFSFHDTPELLQEVVAALKDDGLEFVQIQLNYLDWDIYRSEEQYNILTKAGIPAIVMEPLRGGELASINEAGRKVLSAAAPESTPAQWAFRFVGSLPNVFVTLSGMTRMEHLVENVGTFTDFAPLTPAEKKTLDAALVAYRSGLGVPCTGCRYCMPCPEGVDIPRIFGLHNQYKATGNRWMFESAYKGLGSAHDASACIYCELCVEQCPQHINIPEELASIHADVSGKSALHPAVRDYLASLGE
ncbi:MAG: aldo/keto reductase [Akkermansia sp.]|nr:aldo/keto reductase [Akkermansia sp.]